MVGLGRLSRSYAEKNPGKLTIGGSEAVNMGIAYMLSKAGIRDKVTFVPYSSTSNAVADFLGGHISLMGATSSTAETLIPNKAVAVANTGSLPELEGVPTAKDLGYSGIVFPALGRGASRYAGRYRERDFGEAGDASQGQVGQWVDK